MTMNILAVATRTHNVEPSQILCMFLSRHHDPSGGRVLKLVVATSSSWRSCLFDITWRTRRIRFEIGSFLKTEVHKGCCIFNMQVCHLSMHFFFEQVDRGRSRIV
ncbi:unnamed protein product [Amoebophrya sp. A120]|nr:unnamed protein product [Amoebophrya sp. A120]|eukprot:GSA120T00006832001.1